MEWVQVESSSLSAVAYDTVHQLLYVKFKEDNTIYLYYDVPVSIYNDLVQATSIGGFYSRNVRDKYRYWRVN